MSRVIGTGRQRKPLLDRLGAPLPLDLLVSYRRRPSTEINAIKAMRAAVFWTRHSGRKRIRQIAKLLLWLAFPVMVFSAVRQSGSAARESFGRGYLGQALDIARLGLHNGMRPQEYYAGGLARFHGRPELLRFIPFELYAAVASTLAGKRTSGSITLEESKLKFEEACRARSLPVVTTLATVDAAGLHNVDGTPLGRLPAEELLVKPAQGYKGLGVELWRHRGDGFVSSEGEAMSGEALLARLRALAGRSRQKFLLQRREYNHPDIAEISAPALSTIRFVTILNEGGEPEIVDAFYRTASLPTAAVDNFFAGGTWFPVDDDGIFAPGYGADYPEHPVRCDRHPLSGRIMSGSIHPGATASRDLALRAHRAFADLFIVGWDIAYARNGPMLVEFNVPPGIDPTSQDSTDGFIGTRLSTILSFHARRWIESNVSPGSRWRPMNGAQRSPTD